MIQNSDTAGALINKAPVTVKHSKYAELIPT